MTQPAEPQEPATPPAAPEPPAAPPAAPTPPAPPAREQGNGNADILSAISAMPERIVDSLREALTPPAAPKPDAAPAAEANTATENSGKSRRTFAEMWFGK